MSNQIDDALARPLPVWTARRAMICLGDMYFRLGIMTTIVIVYALIWLYQAESSERASPVLKVKRLT